MTIREYLSVVRERWVVTVLALLVGLAGGAAVFFLRPQEYTATLTMYVSSQGADTTQAAFQGAQLSQDRVASYTELLVGPRVTSDVIRRLKLPETSTELADKMTATSKLDSVLLDVTVTDPSAQRATDIANAVGDVFPDLVAELERPTTPGVQPAVAVRVVQPALVPTQPSSANLPLTLTLGLLAGLVLGIGGALARNALDVRVKSPEQLKALIGAPSLGVIAFDPDVPRRPLTVYADPQSPRSEAFRQLRTNLQFIDVDSPRKVILVTSAMPGEGKTTTLINLAIAISSAGSRVLVVEADLRRPRLSDLLGVERMIGLTSVLSGRIDLPNAIQAWGRSSVDILASGPLPPNPSELLASRQMKMLLDCLRDSYDVILIDSPPLLPVTDGAALAPATDGAVMMCRFGRTTRAQVESARDALEAVSAPLLGTVLTMLPSSGPHAYARYNSYYRSEPVNGRSASRQAPESPGGRSSRRAPTGMNPVPLRDQI
jgi:capsular exopolysaccharide synthesis family protein